MTATATTTTIHQKNLRGGESVAIAVSSNLARATDVVITDGSPPDDRRGVGELTDQLVDGAGVDPIIQLSTQSAVPAFDQVDDVHHDDERDRNVDVTVVARVDQSAAVATSRIAEMQLTPGKCR